MPASVLMTNHVHLLLTPESADGPALLMRHLGQRYVQHVNRTYKRSGTLWEGRFRSCLTQTEGYVLACYRYIELNPVRTTMLRRPRQIKWSSHRTNAESRNGPLITPHDEYRRLGRTKAARREAYRALFKAPIDKEADLGLSTTLVFLCRIRRRWARNKFPVCVLRSRLKRLVLRREVR
jgi:putative transposase